jgi:phosphatidylglycerol:prolipoprotein diacylglycerol transferase
MHPILFKIGTASVSSYSLMLSLTFVIGIIIALIICKKHVISANHIFGLMISIQISGVVGSRLLYAYNNYSQFESDISRIFSISSGGFDFTGGLFLSVITGYIYIKFFNLSFWKIADYVVPIIAVGIVLTKIGCFLGGCCYGKETAFFLAVQFPANSLAAQKYGIQHLVHPTQLYEAFSGLMLFFITLIALHKRRKFDGQFFLIFMILYIAVRAINEMFRGDVIQNYFFSLSQTQFFGLILVLVGILIYWLKMRDIKISKLVSSEYY